MKKGHISIFLTHKHTLFFSHTHALSLYHSHRYTTLSLYHSHRYTHSLSLSLLHTHTLYLSLSYIHTQSLSVSLSLSLSHSVSPASPNFMKCVIFRITCNKSLFCYFLCHTGYTAATGTYCMSKKSSSLGLLILLYCVSKKK